MWCPNLQQKYPDRITSYLNCIIKWVRANIFIQLHYWIEGNIIKYLCVRACVYERAAIEYFWMEKKKSLFHKCTFINFSHFLWKGKDVMWKQGQRKYAHCFRSLSSYCFCAVHWSRPTTTSTRPDPPSSACTMKRSASPPGSSTTIAG